MAKEKKPKRPSAKDKEIKAKPTGYRFKTKDVPALTKQDGTLTKQGKKLKFKRPTKSEIENYKKRPDGSYPNETKQIYHEKRPDRRHSDDNLKKRFDTGGAVIEMSVEEMRAALGREPRYPYDFIQGKKYVKCFLRPYYKLQD